MDSLLSIKKLGILIHTRFLTLQKKLITQIAYIDSFHYQKYPELCISSTAYHCSSLLSLQRSIWSPWNYCIIFVDLEVFFSSRTMFIKEFTLIHLVTTFTISRSYIRMKICWNTSKYEIILYCKNELVVKYKVVKCHYAMPCTCIESYQL